MVGRSAAVTLTLSKQDNASGSKLNRAMVKRSRNDSVAERNERDDPTWVSVVPRCPEYMSYRSRVRSTTKRTDCHTPRGYVDNNVIKFPPESTARSCPLDRHRS